MTLTHDQKDALTSEQGKMSTCSQLQSKGLAEIEDGWRDEGTKGRMAVISLTEKGKKVQRMIDDPTVTHV